MSNELEVVYEATGGNVKLTPEIVKKYLTNNVAISDQDFMLFASLCKAKNLNPFTRECYIMKYGNNPATIITSKDAFFKMAYANPDYDGIEDGIVIETADGKVEDISGCVLPNGAKLLGGWAKVYSKRYRVPKTAKVSMKEYAKTTKEGKLMSNWASMPCVMINKCAKVAALREAFPDTLNGMYVEEEFEKDRMSETNKVMDENTGEVIDATSVKGSITEGQIEVIESKLQGENLDKMLKHYGVAAVKDLNAKQASEVCIALAQAH